MYGTVQIKQAQLLFLATALFFKTNLYMCTRVGVYMRLRHEHMHSCMYIYMYTHII
jgi:hypothetical protein